MLTFAICDDEPNQIEYVNNIVTSWAEANHQPARIYTFSSSEAFLFEYSENNCFDILLLDIEMGKINGIELARTLREKNFGAQIIFITGYPDFISEGYDVAAIHYLLKPVKKEKLFEVLDRAAAAMAEAPRSFLFFSGKESIRVYADDIRYAESDGHYILLHTSSENYRFRMTIPETEEQLGEGFYRCGRSFVVNLKYVARITKTSVFLEGGTELPLSKGLYDKINKELIKYLRGL